MPLLFPLEFAFEAPVLEDGGGRAPSMSSQGKIPEKASSSLSSSASLTSFPVGVIGEFVGSVVIGDPVGELVGGAVGGPVGDFVGGPVGDFVGGSVGDFVGGSVGDFVGSSVGDRVGSSVGSSVGDRVGDPVGDRVGGLVVGAGSGMQQASSMNSRSVSQ